MLDADSRYPVRSSALTGPALADRLASALTDRDPGWRLPRRSALAKRYDVGIGEIDAAIADLVDRSLIRRLPDGQLYRASPAGHWILVEGTAGLGTRLDPMGNTITCLTRQVSRGEAPPDVAAAFGQPPRVHLRTVRCVWSAGDDPVAVSAAYLPGPQAGEDDETEADGADAEFPPSSAATSPLPAVAVSVEMSPPQPEVARVLRVPAGEPAITVTVRFGDDADGEPSAVTVVTLKPELFRVAIDVTRTRAG